jgi:hypothetical protein
MNIEVESVFSESIREAVACMSHSIAQEKDVLEVAKEAADKRQGEMCQSDELGDKVVWMSEAD